MNKLEELAKAHHQSGPHKSALEAIKSPTFAAFHKERRATQAKNKAIKAKSKPYATVVTHGTKLKIGQKGKTQWHQKLKLHDIERDYS